MRDIIRAESATDAWLKAVSHLQTLRDWRDYNLVLEIANPMRMLPWEKKVSDTVNEFLMCNEKQSINTIINTIFPAAICAAYGPDQVFKQYNLITPDLCRHIDNKKWGTYFMRMVSRQDGTGHEVRPLEHLIHKLRRETSTSAPKRAIYELNIGDPVLDIPIYDSTSDQYHLMGGPCLSHLSFKLKSDKSLLLTVMYRSHYYIQRALGNFYGLAFLQDFVAKSAGIRSAELICHSTMAKIDTDHLKRADVEHLLTQCHGFRSA